VPVLNHEQGAWGKGLHGSSTHTSSSWFIFTASFTRATRIAESIGKIFNPEDLDRRPEPVLQPSPTYPFSMKREGLSASVLVEFIVDVEGRVREIIVVDSTHTAFNDAAIVGVGRWKFKPGVKAGRKVKSATDEPTQSEFFSRSLQAASPRVETAARATANVRTGMGIKISESVARR